MSAYHPFRTVRFTIAVALLTEAAAALAGPAFPRRKDGLWEMRVETSAKGQPMTLQQCADAATDRLLQEQGASRQAEVRKPTNCQEDMRSEVGRVLTHKEVCKLPDTTMTRLTVVTGDMNSSYRVSSHTTYAPPRAKQDESDMTMEAQWKGACPAGMRPGDMVLPGGMKMNVVDMQRMTAPMGAAAAAGRAPTQAEIQRMMGQMQQSMSPEDMRRMAAEMQKAMPARAGK